MTVTGAATGAVQTTGEVLGVKRVGAHHQVSLVAPGVPDRFRPGSVLALTVGGPFSDRAVVATYPIHRVRPTGPHGGTVDLVLTVEPGDRVASWLVSAPAGTRMPVTGPLGRPFALPKEAVTCVLVGQGAWAAPLFGLADRLRERGCTVHMLLGGAGEQQLFGALEARRSTRSVTVVTGDGSVGARGDAADALPALLERVGADVVYAAAPWSVLHRVAAAAERHGAWSQTMLVDVPLPCGTGMCHACVVPLVGEDGVARRARACVDGPVVRGDRVQWEAS